MVRGADHVVSSSTAYLSACPESSGSSQLMYTRPPDATDRFGSALPGAAGLGRVTTEPASSPCSEAHPGVSAAPASPTMMRETTWRIGAPECEGGTDPKLPPRRRREHCGRLYHTVRAAGRSASARLAPARTRAAIATHPAHD